MNLIPTELKACFFSIKDNPSYSSIIGGINFAFSLLFVFWLPFDKSFLLYIVFLWVLTWLLEGNFIKKAKQNIERKRNIFLLLLPVLFYSIHILGYFISSNKSAALFDLEVKLSLLIFPIVFLTANTLYKKYGKLILKFFIAGIIVASMISIILAISHSSSFVNGEFIFQTSIYKQFNNQSFFELVGRRFSFFSYVELSVFHHPSYFSMYLIFGVLVSYYLYRSSERVKYKSIYLGIILLFYVMVYLLSTRAGLLALSTTLISLIIIEFAKSRSYALVFLVFFSLNYGLYKAMTLSKLKQNVVELKNIVQEKSTNEVKKVVEEEASVDKVVEKKQIIEKEKIKTKPQEFSEKKLESADKVIKVKKTRSQIQKKDTRIIIWENAISVIKENILLGVGNGDVRDALTIKYTEQGFESGIKNRFNTHNQFLESMLSGGLSAIIVLMTMFIYSFFYSIKNRRILLSFLVCLVGFNFLFESMLNTIAGVIFFSFFYTFLLIYTPPRLESKK